MSKTLFIRQLSRIDAAGNEESLEFKDGVNIIVGPSNSGKTVWMAMLDYILGDDSSADKAFFEKQDALGRNLAHVYSEVWAIVEIDAVEYVLQRKWKEHGLITKTLVDGTPMDTGQFSRFILEKLQIPTSRFIQGNPYSKSSLMEISFRTLLRHIYRQERFWNDLADRQLPLEQHAVLTQFLDLADKIFSPVNEKLLERKRELFSLQARKEQFENTLDQIVRGFNYDGGENIVYATNDVTAERIKALETRSNVILQERNAVISGAARQVLSTQNIEQTAEVQLSQQRAQVFSTLDQLETDREKHTTRIKRYEAILSSATTELDRLHRIKNTGSLFADLKVTHCPACDQPVVDEEIDPDHCFLCHRTLPTEKPVEENNRLEFEIIQVQDEQKELIEVLGKMRQGQDGLDKQYYNLRNELARIDQKLAPIKQQLAGLVDARLSALDQERGRILEQIENYRRIAKSLDIKSQIVKQIATLTTQVADLEKDVARLGSPNFEQAAEDLEDGMMKYINAIVKDKPSRWTLTGRLSLLINERGFDFNVGRLKWSSIGGTTKLYFLFAYHYGLLSLTGKKNYHYPGLLIMDFLATLPDGEFLKRAENYLVQPFIDLCENSETRLQVIIAGQSFEGLDNCHILELKEYAV